jgi:hypothetical protein
MAKGQILKREPGMGLEAGEQRTQEHQNDIEHDDASIGGRCSRINIFAALSSFRYQQGYHQKAFVYGCRQREVSPHVACKDGVRLPGLDTRTTTKPGYQTSLRIRKRVEEIFGWVKTVGGLRRTRYLGRERTQAWAYFVAGTYNLLRVARLELVSAR